jgi:hypothetical protein
MRITPRGERVALATFFLVYILALLSDIGVY